MRRWAGPVRPRVSTPSPDEARRTCPACGARFVPVTPRQVHDRPSCARLSSTAVARKAFDDLFTSRGER